MRRSLPNLVTALALLVCENDAYAQLEPPPIGDFEPSPRYEEDSPLAPLLRPDHSKPTFFSRIKTDPISSPGRERPEPIESKELKAAWEVWQKTLSDAIELRFKRLASAAFGHSKPLTAEIEYVVTDKQAIENIVFTRPSRNPIFDKLISSVLESFNNCDLLKFPAGTSRTSITESAAFSQNTNLLAPKYNTSQLRNNGKASNQRQR